MPPRICGEDIDAMQAIGSLDDERRRAADGSFMGLLVQHVSGQHLAAQLAAQNLAAQNLAAQHDAFTAKCEILFGSVIIRPGDNIFARKESLS